jgi:hypothetical protein
LNSNNILDVELKVVNIGSEIFSQALKDQNADVIQLDWSPPRVVVLSKRISEIMDKME